MVEIPEATDLNKNDLIDIARNLKSRAKEEAPTTVVLTGWGVTLGAVAFGPAGGVVGATVGSSIGYLQDEGYFDSEEEPEVVEANVEDEL